MANPDQGQVQFSADGKTWTLTLTNRALRSVETELKKPWGTVLKDMMDGGALTDRLAIFAAALRVNHPNGEISDDAVMDMVGPAELYRLTNNLIQAAYAEETKENPPKPGQQ